MDNNTKILNQMIQIIDEKASSFKKKKKTLSKTAAETEKLLITKTIQDAIKEAGFDPQLRNQQYGERELPANIQEQVVNY